MSSAAAASPTYSPQRVGGSVVATYIAFIGAGFAFASWASRIPQVRDHLALSSAELGLVLLAIAVGALVALPLGGVIVHRLSSRHTVAAMSGLVALALAVVAVGYLYGVVPLLIGLLLLGFGNGAWDVAMNVQGASVERHLGRAIMPRFHAGYSVGTVAGAGIGAGLVALGVPVTAHLLAAAVVIVAVVPTAVRRFLPDEDELPTDEPVPADGMPSAGSARSALARWREPRTLLVGVFVLAFAFAEGTGNDWIGVSLIDGYGTSAAVGTLGFALFLAAMTTVRWFGTTFLDRYGRVVTLRVLSVLGIVGLLLFVFGPNPTVAFVGVALWGAGAALGFPVGMSAASDEPAAAAARVSVVASIGYCAFLAGPPVIGLLGEHVTVLKALTVVAVLVGLATLIAGSLRPPAEVTRPE